MQWTLVLIFVIVCYYSSNVLSVYAPLKTVSTIHTEPDM